MSPKDSNPAPGPSAQYFTGELGKKGEHWGASYDTRQLPRTLWRQLNSWLQVLCARTLVWPWLVALVRAVSYQLQCDKPSAGMDLRKIGKLTSHTKNTGGRVSIIPARWVLTIAAVDDIVDVRTNETHPQEVGIGCHQRCQ